MQDLGADLEANGYRGIGHTEQPMDHLSIRPINPFLGVQQPMGGHTLLGNTPVSTPVFLNLGPQLQPRLTPRPTLASGQENQNRPRPTLASGQVNPNGLSFEFGNPNVRVPNGNPNVRVPTSTTCDAHLPPPVGTPINTAPSGDPLNTSSTQQDLSVPIGAKLKELGLTETGLSMLIKLASLVNQIGIMEFPQFLLNIHFFQSAIELYDNNLLCSVQAQPQQ